MSTNFKGNHVQGLNEQLKIIKMESKLTPTLPA